MRDDVLKEADDAMHVVKRADKGLYAASLNAFFVNGAAAGNAETPSGIKPRSNLLVAPTM